MADDALEQSAREIMELFVEALQAERDASHELLLVHLSFFGEDVAKTVERLQANPALAVSLVRQLSTLMQALDTEVGAVDALTKEIGVANRWAIVVPGGIPARVIKQRAEGKKE